MISSRRKTTGGRDYKVKDLSLADLGRLEIELAQFGMPGLMACRDEFSPYNPFKGSRITVSSPVTARYAVLIETLTALGAQVRWCSSNYFSCTEDHAAAAIARDGASVFAWKGQTPEECWWCTERALDFGDGLGPDLIVDLSGNVTLLIDEGVKAEKVYAKTGQLPDPSSSADNAELQIVLGIIRDGLKNDLMRFQRMTEALVGVSIETAAGVKTPCLQMQAPGTLFPVIDVNDSVTESKFNSLLGCRYGLLDGIRRLAENMKIYGKKAVVWGYDDALQGCAISLNQAGADLVVYEADPSLALRACLRGFKVIETLDDVVSEADIIVTNIHVVGHHVRKMKNNAIIYNTDTILLDHNNGYKQNSPGLKIFVVDPQTEKWVIPETKSSVTVLRNTAGYPNFMESWSCTSHMLAMLELWSNRGTVKYENKAVYDLPEHIEEKMAALHLSKLTAAAASVMETKGKPNDDDVFVQKSDQRMLLITVVKACSLLGMVALGLTKASKVGKDVSFPNDLMDLPLSAIWDNMG